MSTHLKSKAENVTLNRFFGGKDRGPCVQVTVKNPGSGRAPDFVQLTREQAFDLAKDLLDFAAGREEEDWDV